MIDVTATTTTALGMRIETNVQLAMNVVDILLKALVNLTFNAHGIVSYKPVTLFIKQR
jgi:hypothetical protein